ncbi:MAG: ATP-binding cassette domain-containing protein [Clostridia bacterium]|nr:ATP-binding cassette domain-containing protein [Clostridia bacterium]
MVEHRLELAGLTKHYGKKCALRDFSCTFTSGITGILGANGAGKSTMMNLITDNVKREKGQILFDSKDVLELGRSFRAQLGYMPQQQGMYDDMSARGFLLYIAELKGIKAKQARKEVETLLELVSLSDNAHRKLGGFSGGMRQRVLLAQALMGTPQVIILDEPTAGLDPQERIRIRNYVKALAADRIVLWTTHIVSDIESIAKEILLMKEGRLIAFDTPQNLLKDNGQTDLEGVYMKLLGDMDVCES